MRWTFKALLGAVIAAVVYATVPGANLLLVGGVFILAALTPSLTVVAGGVLLAALFGVTLGVDSWLEANVDSPVYRYAFMFAAGTFVGGFEGRVKSWVFD